MCLLSAIITTTGNLGHNGQSGGGFRKNVLFQFVQRSQESLHLLQCRAELIHVG